MNGPESGAGVWMFQQFVDLLVGAAAGKGA